MITFNTNGQEKINIYAIDTTLLVWLKIKSMPTGVI